MSQTTHSNVISANTAANSPPESFDQPKARTDISTDNQEPGHKGAKHPPSGSTPANRSVVVTFAALSKSSIASVEPPQSSQQLKLPIWDLPIPPVVQMPLRKSDKRIEHALAPLEPFPVTRLVYSAMLLEGRKTDLHPTHHYCVQIGYARIATIIRERKSVFVSKRSIQRAIDRLIDFKYLQRTVPAHNGIIAATYIVLNCAAVMRMLSDAGCEHFRLLRGCEMQFIRPM